MCFAGTMRGQCGPWSPPAEATKRFDPQSKRRKGGKLASIFEEACEAQSTVMKALAGKAMHII